MRTISILSQKGGAGKTTLTIHLAVAATQAGQRVVIADLDEQASATMWHRSRKEEFPHVQPTHSAALSQIVPVAAEEGVDLLLIDTAPQSDKAAVSAAEAADLILIPCRPSVMDLRAIQNTVKLTQIADIKEKTQVLVVLTQVDAFGRLHEEAKDILIEMNIEVVPLTVGRRVAYQHGLIDGRTAQEFDPKGKAAKEMTDLYQYICEILPACPHADTWPVKEATR